MNRNYNLLTEKPASRIMVSYIKIMFDIAACYLFHNDEAVPIIEIHGISIWQFNSWLNCHVPDQGSHLAMEAVIMLRKGEHMWDRLQYVVIIRHLRVRNADLEYFYIVDLIDITLILADYLDVMDQNVWLPRSHNVQRYAAHRQEYYMYTEMEL